ncbi:5'-3' DNA helicase ZGRF1 [Elgaria multicarinata webbii]|uniref:5'-3' DNA helicase ZGRF1 n=1 Tax=Elgaria multicarinata webbii TaxID=159646 RepID=UPI002FCCE25B
MACQEFIVLYTHQKTKKSKVWQDGILKSTVGGNKATLFDDKGQILDSIFVKFQVKPGDDLESERYLITVEAEKASETGCKDQPKKKEEPMLTRNHLKSFASSFLHLPVGLKRKYTGFQGPRGMEKKVAMEEPEAIVSSTSKGPHSSFPSQFYISSPLFSMPYKKEEINLLQNFNRDAFTPCADEHKVVQSRNHSTDGADAEYIKPEFQLDNKMFKSNYCANNAGAVSPNLRSKAQILALLNREQKPLKAVGEETTASLKNLSLTFIKSKYNQEGLPLSVPSRSPVSLFKEKISPLQGCTMNTNKETTELIEPLNTEKNVQTKSRWEAYMPSCLAKESPDIDDSEHHGNNASSLKPVKKDLKEDAPVTRIHYSEDNKWIVQVPVSLESNISLVNKRSVKKQPHTFVPTESIMSKEDTEVVSSFNSIHYSNCTNASKTFEDKLPKSNKHTTIGNLQNESDKMVCSEPFSNDSVYEVLGDSDKQFTEVNFNLLETLDFSDTEEGELHVNSMLSQRSRLFKEETEKQLEVNVQKNCDVKASSSEGKDNVQSAFQQDRDIIHISESQPLQFCDEISVEPNKMKENDVITNSVKTLQHSEATIVDEKIKANAIDIQNVDDYRGTSRDLLMENDVDCDVSDSEYHNQTTQLRKNNMIPYVPIISNGYFMDENDGAVMEVGADNSQPSSTGICDNVKPLAFPEKYNCSDNFLQHASSKQYSAPEKNYDLDFRPSTHPLNCEISDKTEMSKNELENAACVLDFFHKFNEDTEKDSIYVKSSDDSSKSPPLEDGFRLLRSLTEHSTALESLQMIEESIPYQRERLREKQESSGPEAKQKFAEVSSSEDVQISSYVYSGSPKLNSSINTDEKKPTTATIDMLQGHIPFEVADSQQKMLSTQWIPSEFSGCHFPTSPSSKETVVDMQEQEFLMSRIVPDLSMDNEIDLLRMEESSCPENNDMSKLLPIARTRIPVVTVPVDEELPNSEVYSNGKACEEIQQSFGFSVVKSKMLRPEDRMCETFAGEKCIGEKQGVLTQYAFPNMSEQKRQSKWQKYQNRTCSDLRTQNSSEMFMTDDIRAESVLGMPLDGTRESQSDAINKSPPDSVHLQMMKSMLCKQQRNFSSQDSVSEGKKLSLHFSQKFSTEEAPKILGQLNCYTKVYNYSQKNLPKINTSGLSFPSAEMVMCANIPKRQIYVPAEFQSPAHYKQIFTTALTEHLNVLLFELSQKLHKALEKVDISFYTSMKGGQEHENSAPLCKHKIATKLVMVKKEGRNKGRLFYACDAPKSDRCDFFKWLEDVNPGQIESRPSVALHDTKSIGTYLRSQKISLYEESQLLMRKTFDIQRKQFGKLKKLNIATASFDCDSKSKLYLKLNRKEHSSVYSKDDLWVVSRTLIFEPLDTFIACSVFYGPSSSNEVELVPLKGYSPSNWCSNMIVHALLVCNASTELTTLRNIEENISPTLPIMQHLLTKTVKGISYSNKVKKQKFKSPALNTNIVDSGLLSQETMINLANKLIQTFQLNKDQAKALLQIGAMMTSEEINTEIGNQKAFPITVIHGVFGSGKSYLLAIVTLFLVQIFETREAINDKRSVPWKVLISSSTNVAVDRVLLCLLDLGFEEFIRVGSVRKIAKPVLPYSLHAGSGTENEQLKELLSLMKEDLTPAEKIYVRKTIEHHKLGTNKALLQQVRVVGATCAACPFSCMKNLKFPIVILDECSQMTEPASLLPIARFECEKLILVGDPKQLSPTIQGSESAHGNGLEQTLFNRLCLMGHEPILLRMQYRCHPVISAIPNDLFYEGNLLNGISEVDRSPIIDWLPTLCFYNVDGFEQMERDNSFHNMAESFFTVKLIQSLIASGADGSLIGVIALYKSQMSKICNLLGAVHSEASQIKAVQVSTVDAFQGAEKEIVVLSCVRTRQVGFIDSEKRVNVALTRGKRHLLIVGNLKCLRKNKLWGSIIQHCAGRKNGLQHVSQCEQQLNEIIKSCLEKKEEEEKNTHKKKSRSKTFSQKTNE